MLRKRSFYYKFWLAALAVLLFVPAMTASAASSSTPSDKINFANNKYYLFNNVWGQGQVQGWTQSIFHNNDKNMGWNWNWPSNTSSVKGYPSIVSGWHWTAGYTPGSGLPVRLWDNKNINTSVNYSIKANGTYNAAYDVWFHETDKASSDSAQTDELMIWLNNTKAGPAGSYVETVSLAGSDWDLYKGWIDAGNGKGWNVFSFVRKKNTNSASFNIKNFTDYIIYTKKWMSNAKFMSSVEFGTEIFGGSGSMNISKWNVNVQ